MEDTAVAFWISPSGVIVSTHGSHTSTVLDDPECFGLTKEIAESLFATGEEEAIIKYLLCDGWVRVRLQFGMVFISVENLTSSVRRTLQGWSFKADGVNGHTKVVLDVCASNECLRLFLYDIQNGNFFGSRFNLDGQVKDEYVLWSVLRR